MLTKKRIAKPRGANAPGGSQSILRAMSVLRFVAAGREDGRRLTEVASALNLNVATAHRMLGTLTHLGLLVHRADAKSYRVGPELISLAAIGHAQFALGEAFRPAMTRIAKETGDTVLLQIFSGDETVCIARVSGSDAFATLVMNVGSRLPLGVGAAGLAKLAYLDEQEAEDVLRRCSTAYTKLGLSVDVIRGTVRKSRAYGYGFQEGQFTREVGGLGVLMLDAQGEAAAAVSVIALRNRLTPARRTEIAMIIRDACGGMPGISPFPAILPGDDASNRKKRATKKRA